MYENVIAKIEEWWALLQSIEVLMQLGAAVLVLILSRVLLKYVQKQFLKLKEQLGVWTFTKDLPFIANLVLILRLSALPMLVWALTSTAKAIFQNLELSSNILAGLLPFWVIWLCFRFLRAAFEVNLSPEKAKTRGRQIRPIFIIVLVLNAMGLLDDFLALGIQPSEEMVVTIQSLVAGLIVIYLSTIIAKHVKVFLRESLFPKLKMEEAITQIVSTLAYYIIVISGVLAGLQVLGIELTTLTWLLGGLSVGIGFGLKELINNFISGFILLFERSVIPGDFVEVEGIKGDVKEVKLRSTLIRTRNNNSELFVPNGKLLGDTFINYSSTDPFNRVEISVRTGYQANPHDVIALIIETVNAHPRVSSEKQTRVLVDDFTDDGFLFLIRTWIEEPRAIRAFKAQVRLSIWDAFTENGIELPVSQHDVKIRGIDKAKDSMSNSDKE